MAEILITTPGGYVELSAYPKELCIVCAESSPAKIAGARITDPVKLREMAVFLNAAADNIEEGK